MSSRQMYETGLSLRRLTSKLGLMFIVNDRVDIALAVEADGVHLGQDDLPLFRAKQLAPNLLFGVTAETPEQAREAEQHGADYLGTAAVFSTQTKVYKQPPLGLQGLKQICQATSLPVIAIGGIKPENARQVIEAGAAGVAAVSAIVSADNVETAARELRLIIENKPKQKYKTSAPD